MIVPRDNQQATIYRSVVTDVWCEQILIDTVVYTDIKVTFWHSTRKLRNTDKAQLDNTNTYDIIINQQVNIMISDVIELFERCNGVFLSKWKHRVDDVQCFELCWSFNNLQLSASLIC